MCTGYHSLLQTFIAFGASINNVTIFFKSKIEKKDDTYSTVRNRRSRWTNSVLPLNKFSNIILFIFFDEYQPPGQFSEHRYFFFQKLINVAICLFRTIEQVHEGEGGVKVSGKTDDFIYGWSLTLRKTCSTFCILYTRRLQRGDTESL